MEKTSDIRSRSCSQLSALEASSLPRNSAEGIGGGNCARDACFGRAGDHTSDTATASRTLSLCSASTDIRRVTPRRGRRTT